MKPIVEAVKSIFGKRRGYTAKFGEHESTVQPTKDEAMDEMNMIVERAFCGSYTPEIISYRDNAMIVARHPVYGWGSRLVERSEDGGIKSGAVSLSSSDCHSRNDAVDNAKYHLAQIGWMPGEPMPSIVPPSRSSDFASWMEFQNRYYDARNLGMSDGDAHDYAGRNPARAELWVKSVS